MIKYALSMVVIILFLEAIFGLLPVSIKLNNINNQLNKANEMINNG